MMKSRFLLAAALFLALCLPARADRVLDAFVAKASSSTMGFSFTVRSTDVELSGSAKVRGSSYIIDVLDIEIWSDGNLRWSVDRQAREVVVEEPYAAGTAADPARILSDFESSFSLKSSDSAVFRGVECHAVNLLPKTVPDGSGISSVTLYFSNGQLRGMTVCLDDGSSNEIEISGLRFSDRSLDAHFDTSSLDQDWLVTDLRGF